MSHVTCLDLTCHDGSLAHKMSHSSRVHCRIHISGLCLYLQFAFAIHDMIGHGVMCGDIMMNSFTFSRESHWYMTKSVAFLESS